MIFTFCITDQILLFSVPYYEPKSVNEVVDAPLLPEESLTIGYGINKTSPHNYITPEGQEVDVGFLKLFFSTEYLNLRAIPSFYFENPYQSAPPVEKMSSLYHTMCVPIVQKRVKSAAVDLYNSKPVQRIYMMITQIVMLMSIIVIKI